MALVVYIQRFKDQKTLCLCFVSSQKEIVMISIVTSRKQVLLVCTYHGYSTWYMVIITKHCTRFEYLVLEYLLVQYYRGTNCTKKGQYSTNLNLFIIKYIILIKHTFEHCNNTVHSLSVFFQDCFTSISELYGHKSYSFDFKLIEFSLDL